MFPLRANLSNSGIFDWGFEGIHAGNLKTHPANSAAGTIKSSGR